MTFPKKVFPNIRIHLVMTPTQEISMNIKKVLLTGGCGLVGRTLAPILRKTYEVTHLEMADPGDGLPFIKGDLRSSQDVAKACQGMDAVIHVAALHGQAWVKAGDDLGFEVNVTGTKNILEGAAKAGAKRVVFTSSIWATGHDNPTFAAPPIDETLRREAAELYGLTKILGEQMCRYATEKYGLSTIILRPGGIRPATAGDTRNLGFLTACVDVRDVAQAHVLALQAPDSLKHDVFIITAESPLCKVDLDLFQRDPAAALDAVVPGAGVLVRNGTLPLTAKVEWYTVDKAKRLLGYRPAFNFAL
jgi:nucleoside-diphosphate-sugar epimerase